MKKGNKIEEKKNKENRPLLLLVGLLLISSSTALAMTFGYDVEIQNQLSVPTKVEIAQYHSEGFDGTPPKNFTDNLKLGTKFVVVPPGETRTVHYNSAAGGFWLRWKQVEPSTSPQLSGVIDLGKGERVIKIK